MRAIINSDGTVFQTQNSNSSKILELIALAELYLFCAGAIAVAVLLPVIMLLQGVWNWAYAIAGSVSGILFWYFPFHEFQERFKYSIRHIPAWKQKRSST